jgi:hypothetical protein
MVTRLAALAQKRTRERVGEFLHSCQKKLDCWQNSDMMSENLG